MKVKKRRTFSDEISLLVLKCSDSIDYANELQKLYERGIPAEDLEYLVCEKFKSHKFSDENKKRKFLNHLLSFSKNGVHIDVIKWFIRHNFQYFNHDELVRPINKIFRTYNQLRSNGETDVTEEDLARAVKIVESGSLINDLRKYLENVKKSELFNRIFIAKDYFESMHLLSILELGITDEEFEYIKNSKINKERLSAIYSLLENDIRGENLRICLNQDLDDIYVVWNIVESFRRKKLSSMILS